MDDPIYTQDVRAFDGIGLRPYSPSHLEAAEDGGDLRISWIRRTRIEGDSWDQMDVPLGESYESYLVRVMDGSAVVREVQVSTPEWVYDGAAQAADGLGGSFKVAVAQISDRFGPGLFAELEIGA